MIRYLSGILKHYTAPSVFIRSALSERKYDIDTISEFDDLPGVCPCLAIPIVLGLYS